jgi:hypothetical protein
MMRSSTRAARRGSLLGLTVAALAVGGPIGSAQAAVASRPPTLATAVQTGVYKASGDIAFKILLSSGECPDVNHGNVLKRGTCLAAYGDPRVTMDCPDGAEFQPDYETPLVLPYNVFVPKTGRVTVTTYSYFSDGLEAGRTTFSIVVKANGTARGSVVSDQVTTWGLPTTCSSGRRAFTARHK